MNINRVLLRALVPVVALGLAIQCTSRKASRDGILTSEPRGAQHMSAFVVPLTTEDWHGGYDLEIGERGSAEDLQLDSLADSVAEQLREQIAAMDTREWHTEYNLSNGMKAWAEFGAPEPVTDQHTVSGMVSGLALLDSAGYPENPDSASVERLRQSFPTLPEELNPVYCGLFFCDLDGTPPRDAVVFLHSGGSAGCYALHVAVRSPHRMTFQALDGCRRGMHNMLWRAREKDSLFWATSGYDDSILTVGETEKRFLLVHNNLWWPGSSGIMTEMSDLVVPYFWDGEKLSWDEEAGRVFYEKLSLSLHLLAPPDSEVIGAAIGTIF